MYFSSEKNKDNGVFSVIKILKSSTSLIFLEFLSDSSITAENPTLPYAESDFPLTCCPRDNYDMLWDLEVI